MSTLLTAISQIDQLPRVVSFCKKISRAFEYKLLFSTYDDPHHEVKQECEKQTDIDEVLGSKTSFINTVHALLENQAYDISLIIIPSQLIDKKNNHRLRKLFSALKKLKIPYLFMPQNTERLSTWAPENIVVPICLKEGEKEASAWAGFWVRTFKSKLTLLHPEFNNKDDQTRLWMVLLFIQRLFEKSGITYNSKKNGCKTKETLKTVNNLVCKTPNTLLVVPATRHFSPEYFFTGLPEIILLKNRGISPVLFVNPRHDLYVPCG